MNDLALAAGIVAIAGSVYLVAHLGGRRDVLIPPDRASEGNPGDANPVGYQTSCECRTTAPYRLFDPARTPFNVVYGASLPHNYMVVVPPKDGSIAEGPGAGAPAGFHRG